MAETKESRPVPVSDEKPSDAVVQEIIERNVQDQNGNSHSLGSLIGGSDGTNSRTVVVFIRHFYCSFCQEYVRSLTRDLPPAKLSTLSPPTKLIIIGHGDPALIGQYVEQTGSAFPIYADPTRFLHERLGFVSNLSGVLSTKSPDYIRKNRLSLALDTVRDFAFAGSKMLSSGKVDQNGGELVFSTGSGSSNGSSSSKVDFIHRMRNTADHVEPKDLEVLLTQ